MMLYATLLLALLITFGSAAAHRLPVRPHIMPHAAFLDLGPLSRDVRGGVRRWIPVSDLTWLREATDSDLNGEHAKRNGHLDAVLQSLGMPPVDPLESSEMAVSSVSTPTGSSTASGSTSTSTSATPVVLLGEPSADSATNTSIPSPVASPATNGTLNLEASSSAPASSPPPSVSPSASGPSSGEQHMMVEVIETTDEIPSSVGTMEMKCMTLVSDPTQRFCATFLNGQNIGSDSGLQVPPPNASVSSSAAPTEVKVAEAAAGSSAASPSAEGDVSDTASISSASSASSSNSSSSSDGSTSQPGSPTSLSFDVVVNAATPTATTSIAEAGLAGNSTTASPGLSSDSASLSPTPTPPPAEGAAGPSPSDVSASLSDDSDPSPTPTPTAATSASIASEALSSASAEAANAESSTVPIPGQKMQVLPIGLGIFGGLAGITILIVGYVLWERRKYKQLFHFRKRAQEKAGLSTQGAGMGYGGA